MPRLTLLLGPAGSGKTHRVLSDVAKESLANSLPGPESPLLLVIVPEQQAVATERALLECISELSDGSIGATSRARVMSMTRLANELAKRAGEQQNMPTEEGRSLLLWRLLDDVDDPAERQALAMVLTSVVAELALHGTSASDLRQRAVALPEPPAGASFVGGRQEHLREKLERLARVYEGYCRECKARNLAYEPPASSVQERLASDCWPELAQARVWVDGFAGFTPAEERALKALLETCAEVTATLLLDPSRRHQPHEDDPLDWYTPTRETYQRWRAMASDLGIQPREEKLPSSSSASLPRWPVGSPLSGIALHGLGFQTVAHSPAAQQAARTIVCADQRAEMDACARQILDLAAGGMRFGEISVVLRNLEPYADLLAARFSEHGIPFFLDRRESLNHHPAVELVHCSLRLALDQAVDDDLIALLRTGLLPVGGDMPQQEQWRGRVDQLEHYALEHGLKAYHWLQERPWDWWRSRSGADYDKRNQSTQQEWITARLAELDGWRRELLGPIMLMRKRLRSGTVLTIREVLAALWDEVLTPGLAHGLEQWAQAAEGARPVLAAQHRGVLAALAKLSDELVQLAGSTLLGKGGMSRAEFCNWVEFGLAKLNLGQPPQRLDHVLVTEVERGRHHPVRATLLLGMADDLWPPASTESPYLADAERALLNNDIAGDGGRRLLGRGAVTDAEREPYLALVAATRASEYLYLSRPGADDQGSARPPSLFLNAIAEPLGVGEEVGGSRSGEHIADVGTAMDLAVFLSLQGGNGRAAELLAGDSPACVAIRSAQDWARWRSSRHEEREALAPKVMQGLLGTAPDGSLLLKSSPSQLEAFAACPFQHFARYFLRLQLPEESGLDARDLGGFYHRIFQRTIEQLNNSGYQWPGTPSEIWEQALAVLEESAAELAAEAGRERVPFILERARLLCWHHAHWLHQQLTEHGRMPRYTELSFGRAEAAWPPLVLEGDSLRLELRGSIDRLDLDAAGSPTVVDYKFHGKQVDWARFLAGQQIQLFAYLLATQQHLPSGQANATGAAVEYQPIEPGWQRGGASFKGERIAQEAGAAGVGGASSEGVLPAALDYAGRIMLELAGRICRGEITPWPLRQASSRGWTACSMCDFRAVCRFDPLMGEAYRDVTPGSNKELSQALTEGRARIEPAGGGAS